MKEKTRSQRKYPKKWSKERVTFENQKRDYHPKRPTQRKKDSKKLNNVVGIRR